MTKIITLHDSSTSLTLSPDLQWQEEFSFAPVAQQVDRSITGAVIVQAAATIKGNPVTLAPPDDESAWMSLATLNQLLVWAAQPLQQLTLTMTGVADKTVIFRHQDGAHEAKPVVFYADPEDTDNFLVTLRLMEV